jgi:hypothetical protein
MTIPRGRDATERKRPLRGAAAEGGSTCRSKKEYTRMEVLVVLLVSFVLLRGLGSLGVERLASWRDAGLGAVAIMFLFTGTAHFSGIPA